MGRHNTLLVIIRSILNIMAESWASREKKRSTWETLTTVPTFLIDVFPFHRMNPLFPLARGCPATDYSSKSP